MEFNPNRTPADILKEGSFGETSINNRYSNVTNKQHNDYWKELSNPLNDVDLNSDCYC